MPAISEPLQKACAQAVPVLEDLLAPCRPSDFGQWLATLGVLCAGNMTVEDAKTKIAAYRGLLHPVNGALTQDSLDEAARAFKWFPTYGEVSELLDAEARELKNQLARAKQIRDWKPKQMEKREEPIADPESIAATLAKYGFKPGAARSGQPAGLPAKPIKPLHVRNPATERLAEEARQQRTTAME